MNKFGQSHVFKYDVLLMNNNKYLIWKLMFPRIGDTFVSLDKMMDLVTWEGIYKLMEKITADFGSWAEDDQSITNYMRYKIQVRKIKLDVPYKHLVDVNYELLNHGYIMCLYASLNSDSEPVTLSITAVTTNCNASMPVPETLINRELSSEEYNYGKSSENVMPRKRPNSPLPYIDTSSKKREMESSFSVVKELTYNGVKIPQNFKELGELMKNDSVMARFGFDDTNNRFFDNVYTVRDGRYFAAFHNSFIIDYIRREEAEVKLFFSFSPELLEQFKGIGFEDIYQTLIVFVRLFDQVFPFGYFVLGNTIRHVFEDIIKTIVQWLKSASDAGHAFNSPVVTKCVAPHDLDLHFAIRKYWPNVKLIGCSAQYQREVCEFILKKRTPIENVDSFHNDKKKLINFARSLCYLPEKFISAGIDIIEGIEIDHEKLISCKMQLMENLANKWQAHSISVFNEKCVYRTLQVCTPFNIQIKRELKSENIWKSIEILKSLNKRIDLDFRNTIKVPTGLRLSVRANTANQKKREIVFWTAIADLENDLKTMRQEEAIKAYMEKFFEI